MQKNWKRIIALLCVMLIGFGSIQVKAKTMENYSGKLSVKGAEITTTNTGHIYLKGTDNYLAGNGEDWDSAAVKMIANSNDADSGIFVNNAKQNSGLLKRYNGANNYYFAEGFVASKAGDIVTIKGTFYSQDGAAAVTYEESSFVWDGTQWIDCYKGQLTIEGAAVTNNTDPTNFYIKGTDGYKTGSDNWAETTMMPAENDAASGVFVDGERVDNYFTAHDENSGCLRLRKINDSGNYYYIERIPNVKTGSVLTIKGTFYVYGAWMETNLFDATPVVFEESHFQWNGTKWIDCFSGKLTIEGAEVTNNTNSANFYIKGTDGYKTGSDNWAESTMMPAENDTASGVFVDGERIDNYFTAHDENSSYLRLRKTKDSGNYYYIERIPNVKTGSVLTIKGTFYVYGAWMETNLFDATPVVFEESKFQWNGTKWEDYTTEDEEVIGYTGILKVDSALNTGAKFDATKFFMKGTDSFPLGHEEYWESTIIPIDDASGIYVDGERIENYFSAHDGSNNNVRFRKYTNAGGYHIEKIPNVKIGSVVTIKGSFRVYGNWLEENQFDATPIVFEESSFLYFGDCWMDLKAYQDGTITLDTNQTSSATGLFLRGTVDVHENCTPEESPNLGWETSVGSAGIYKNGVACDATMKNIASGAYYVALESAGIEDGNILTINGIFGYDGRYVNVAECSLIYVKDGWVEGLKDTEVSYDMNADDAFNLKDFMRLKKHMADKTTPISLAQMYFDDGIYTGAMDADELFTLLVSKQ